MILILLYVPIPKKIFMLYYEKETLFAQKENIYSKLYADFI